MWVFEQISEAISAVSAAGLRIDSRFVYLRGQTVDVGSYGGYVNTHACSHKDQRMMEGLARIKLTRLYHSQIFRRWKQRTVGRRDGGDGGRGMTAGNRRTVKNSGEQMRRSRRGWERREEERLNRGQRLLCDVEQECGSWGRERWWVGRKEQQTELLNVSD